MTQILSLGLGGGGNSPLGSDTVMLSQNSIHMIQNVYDCVCLCVHARLYACVKMHAPKILEVKAIARDI